MPQDLLINGKLEDAKNFARIMYFAHGVTFFFSMGLLSIVPLIANYIKRPETEGTIVYSHHSWLIRSFWYYAIAMVLAFIMTLTIVLIPLAWLVWIGAWIWQAYRLIKGFLELNNNRAMP